MTQDIMHDGRVDKSIKDKMFVEIDGKRVDFDGVLEEEGSIFWGCGGMIGRNLSAKGPTGMITSAKVDIVYALSIYGHHANGDYWGIDGVYKRGEWLTDKESGKPVYSVSERLA